jgi:predicted dehydrogenase
MLSTSRFARKRVLPALAQARFARMIAVASRDRARAEAYARETGIAGAYGSYEELLRDPQIDAVYLPLPNHEHAAWTIRAAEAGKHVLCEKPVTRTAEELAGVIDAERRTGVKIGEGFMIAVHPQWQIVRELLGTGRIGRVRAIQSAITYLLEDAGDIRLRPETAGGAFLDVGCYPVFANRMLLGREPKRVFAFSENGSGSRVETMATAILDFDGVQSSFVCGFRGTRFQRMQIIGEQGRIEVDVPFGPSPERPALVRLDTSQDHTGQAEVFEAPLCNQYALEFDAFSRAILDGSEVPVSLENSLGNMRVLDAQRCSAEGGTWATVSV